MDKIIKHAAHSYFTGEPSHDLIEREVPFEKRNSQPGFQFHVGYTLPDGRHMATVRRRAPASEGRCPRCRRSGK